MFLTPTTTNKILALIQIVPNKTSSGYDNINNLLLKSMAAQITVPLEIIFNKIDRRGYIP